MKKLRSLVIAPFFVPEASANRPLLVSEVLSGLGTVDIMTTDFDHQKKTKKKQFQFYDSRRIHYLRVIPYSRNISAARFISHFLFSLRAWVYYLKNKNTYDVIYATLPLNLSAVLVFITSPNKIRIADVVDIWPDVLPFPRAVRLLFFPLFFLWKISFRYAIKNCSVLLTITNRFFRQSISYFTHESSAAKCFYLAGNKLYCKPRKNDPLTVVYVGNIGHLYDFDTLLAALSACRLIPRFYLVGDGDRREWLVNELSRLKIDYRYFGIVYDAERLSNILSACSIGFNGYRNTTAAFSYKANTYFAAGLPILNSMSGDLQELVDKHMLGFNYKSRDVASLETCLNKCTPELLDQLSRNVDFFFKSEIEREIVKKNMISYLSQLLIKQ